jgi:hypothetical protein
VQILTTAAQQAVAAVTDAVETAPKPPPPLEEQEAEDETTELARILLADQMSANWKTLHQEEIAEWQDGQRLTADGKFGPKSAFAMVDKGIGVLPRIRYWPLGGTGTKEGALAAYREELQRKADHLQAIGELEQAVAVRASASAERGEGWPQKPAAVSSDVMRADAEELKRALEEMEAYRTAVLQKGK